MEEERKKKKIYRKLSNKYRLVIMNDQTLEERASLRLSPLNVFVFAGTIMISLITFTIYIIAFTPLREYIPGYTDLTVKKRSIQNSMRTDSLQMQFAYNDLFLQNLQNIMLGKVGKGVFIDSLKSGQLYDTIQGLTHSEDDSLIRKEVESRDPFSLSEGTNESLSGISAFAFFPPVKGTVTTPFNPQQKHYGVDVVSSPDEVIKSTLDGTVILADWTAETGYVIGIQHGNNLFSLYKHNSALLKNVGNVVKAGEVIAIIGNTGELTTGPHLHFEIWYNGNPVNPADYMSF